jgi:hypothetical protein
MSHIYVIHENDAWVEPLRAAFDALSLPYQDGVRSRHGRRWRGRSDHCPNARGSRHINA